VLDEVRQMQASAFALHYEPYEESETDEEYDDIEM
jgi:hypothetical protein